MNEADFLTAVMHQSELMVGHELSAFEREAGHKINAWTRGMVFTWMCTDLQIEWVFNDQILFLRGTRDYYLLYEPIFWRSLQEFLDFQSKFIEEATYRQPGHISHAAFIAEARRYKAELNGSIIQGFLIGAIARAGIGTASILGAKAMNKVGDVETLFDGYDCYNGDEEACAKAIQSLVFRGVEPATRRLVNAK